VHGARGVFAGAVFLFHVVNSGLATWPVLNAQAAKFLLNTTEYGVELFFCISGFVIAGTLRRAISPAAFIKDRAIRIYPVLWASILVIVVLGRVSGTHGFDAMSSGRLTSLLAANLLALPGIFPLTPLHPVAWTLSYELIFYGICAAGWALRRRAGDRRTLFLLSLPCVLIVTAYPRALFFISGLLVAEGFLSARPLASLSRYPLPLFLAFLLAWRLIQELSLPDQVMPPIYEWAGDWRLPLAIFAFAAGTLGFAGLTTGEGVLGRVLRMPALQFMGTISYSFYLWHLIVMAIVKHGMIRSGLASAAGPGAQLLFLAVTLPLSILIAWGSQLLLERRVGAWMRQRLHHRSSLQPATQSAVPFGLVCLPIIRSRRTDRADRQAK
jgi:peptidoglycan/LPS O-acetylase OafA/YrhL